MKPKVFEIFNRMIETNDQALRMAPLENVISAQKTKRGTQILIGFGDDVVTQIARGDFIGGLLLCDRKRFEEVKAQMVAELSTERSTAGEKAQPQSQRKETL